MSSPNVLKLYNEGGSAEMDQYVSIAKLESCEALYDETKSDTNTIRRENILGLKYNQ